jgi:MoaA/NifB/PqqE/SkfB family radical SAM enzyme
MDLSDVINSFSKYSVGSGDAVIFNGGETTLHPDLLPAIQYASKAGADTTLYTNGKRLADIEFVHELIASGIKRITIPLYGVSDKHHDSLTQSQSSFTNTTKGIRNLFAIRDQHNLLEIELKCLMCKPCLDENPRIVDFINSDLGRPDSFVISGLIFSKRLLGHRQELVPNSNEFRDSVNRTLEKAINNSFNTMLCYIPLCILDDSNLSSYLGQVVNERQHISLKQKDIDNPTVYFDNFYPDGRYDVIKTPRVIKHSSCHDCRLDLVCNAYTKLIEEIPLPDDHFPKVIDKINIE